MTKTGAEENDATDFAGTVLCPSLGAILMSLSTIIVAINAKLLKVR